MFCKNCGVKLPDNAEFCSSCGANIKGIEKSYLGDGEEKSNIANMLNECKDISKSFFSMNPVCTVKKYSHEKSYSGIFFTIINALIFSFVSCLNITKMINYGLALAMDKFVSLLRSINEIDSLLSIVNLSSNIQIPTLYSFFLRFLIIDLLVNACEVALVYLSADLKKKKPESLLYVLNIVGIANIPVAVGAVVSAILGCIVPPLAIVIVIYAIIVKLLFLYAGLKEIMEAECEPMWEYSLFILVLGVITTIVVSVCMKGSAEIVMQSIANELGSLTNSMSDLLDIF